MAIPAGPYHPTNALVAVAWLSQRVPGLTPAMVATRLPRDVAAWADAGFVQATPVTGVPSVDIPVRHPLVQVDCWAVALNPDGSVNPAKPPIAKANRLAELIRVATEAGQVYGRPLELPASYLPARVQAAYPLLEPSEVPGDPAGYARVTFDLAIDWVAA